MTSFGVTATCGTVSITHVDTTIAGCLAWGALMRTDGWQMTEPVPCEGYAEPLTTYFFPPVQDERSAA